MLIAELEKHRKGAGFTVAKKEAFKRKITRSQVFFRCVTGTAPAPKASARFHNQLFGML